jgi:hypothetical protein
MPSRSDPPGFEDFLRWLGGGKSRVARDPLPSPEVVAEARAAWQAFQALRRAQRADLAARVGDGAYYEEVELLAAADADRSRWLPRLRTPNGFAISALYAGSQTPGSAPVGLLVECPADLVEVFSGQRVHILAGGQWVEIGEIDVDGKVSGDLPPGVDFSPPFALRVGRTEEQPQESSDSDEPQ